MSSITLHIGLGPQHHHSGLPLEDIEKVAELNAYQKTLLVLLSRPERPEDPCLIPIPTSPIRRVALFSPLEIDQKLIPVRKRRYPFYSIANSAKACYEMKKLIKLKLIDKAPPSFPQRPRTKYHLTARGSIAADLLIATNEVSPKWRK
jgi:hypothetical protein